MLTLIVGICVALALASLFIVVRIKKGGVDGIVTKALASFGFVALGLFLMATKAGQNDFSRYSSIVILCGLVCGLIGDVLLDLKVVYPFHEDKYLTFGMLSFLFGHLFFIGSMGVIFAGNATKAITFPIIFIVVISAIFAVGIWFVTSRYMHLDYGKHALLSTIYAGVLLFTTVFSIYLAFSTMLTSLFIMAVGFLLFLASDLVLSLQYFGGKQSVKSLIILNHSLYYLAQILIAVSIYFI